MSGGEISGGRMMEALVATLLGEAAEIQNNDQR